MYADTVDGHLVLVWDDGTGVVLEVLVLVWGLYCSTAADFVLGLVLGNGSAVGLVVQM